MKLTVINNQVIFDYSEVELTTSVSSPYFTESAQVREFLRDTQCQWAFTRKHNQMFMEYTPYDFATEYGRAKQLLRLLYNCQIKAKYLSCIEITEEFNSFLIATEKRCQELYDAEVEKEKALKREAEWKDKCKYGCGKCQNLCYDLDLPICKCTKEQLQERNEPVYKGKTLQLFNLVPFPSKNCPFAV